MNSNTSTENIQVHNLPVVILAAGEGCRMLEGNGRIPKPLTSILGKTLLERSIHSCREAGCNKFYVVVGCYEKEIVSFIEQLDQELDISIQAVWNPRWREGNGTSVSAVSTYIDTAFLLLMCDHLCDPSILNQLIAAQNGESTSVLAVDYRTDNIFDIDDATMVQISNMDITAIGKNLTLYNAVDTGFFLCQPSIFDALKSAQNDGDGSLSGGIRNLIKLGRIKTVKIGNRFWFDIDTPVCLSRAKHLLLSALSKPKEDGYIARAINRPISRNLTELLVKTSVTPNTITVLSFLICCAGAYLFSFGEYGWTLFAGVLIQLASITDGCDGEIARLKFQSSRFGAWFDTILDRYADVAIAAGIAFGSWQMYSQSVILIGSFIAISGFIMASYTNKEYELRFVHRLPKSILNMLKKRDSRLFILFLGALFNQPFVAMVCLGVLSHIGVGVNIINVYRLKEQYS
jgi:choline kinase/phosphatidylglycerophosphate synthase